MGKAASHSDVMTQVTGHPLTTASGPRRLTPQGPRPHGADRRSTAPGGTQLALPRSRGILEVHGFLLVLTARDPGATPPAAWRRGACSPCS